jgi:bacillithiol biosynthesis cysteine-adding enzyme BshC
METSSVTGACYPLSIIPGLSPLFAAYLAQQQSRFYPAPSFPGNAWMTASGSSDVSPAPALADLLDAQNHAYHAGPAAIANIAKLRTGARAVVTGQQVGLFGGPLYTLHKAATAVRLAREATVTTGTPHVPIFWLATEDHDFDEIDHVDLQAADGRVERVRLGEHAGRGSAAPVGTLRLGSGVDAALAQAEALLGAGPQVELLRRCYRPESTFAGAFAQWIATVFREQGLIVFDAAGRAAHAMGQRVLRQAITDAPRLEQLLLERGAALEAETFHQQVRVKPGASLLFLLSGEAENEPHVRQPLKRSPGGVWTAGGTQYSSQQLLDILDREPERLSPNALLRPVFQDAILPTAAYIGGPAEVAYFAQSAVLYEAILGRVTPVLPRLSATLLTPRDAQAMEHDGIDLPEVFRLPLSEMQARVAARALSLEGKQRLHAAGTAMTAELDALTAWMASLDEGLGRAAQVSASKMRYQMNRLRRLAARWEMEKDASIARRVAQVYAAAYPGGHLQERGLGAAAALERFGSGLIDLLVAAAGDPCPGHKAIVP